jgi:hypothetical protein
MFRVWQLPQVQERPLRWQSWHTDTCPGFLAKLQLWHAHSDAARSGLDGEPESAEPRSAAASASRRSAVMRSVRREACECAAADYCVGVDGERGRAREFSRRRPRLDEEWVVEATQSITKRS